MNPHAQACRSPVTVSGHPAPASGMDTCGRSAWSATPTTLRHTCIAADLLPPSAHRPYRSGIRSMNILVRSLALLPLLSSLSFAVEAGNDAKTPSGPDKNEEDFLKSLKVPEGMSPAVWAKGQQILNAIAIDVDEKGRVFTSETFRWRK